MLLSDYLAKRSQFTVCNDVSLNESNVLCGVPQVLTLGPLLFSISINYLAIYTKFSVKMFADDIVFFKEPKLYKLENIVFSELR